MSSFKYVLDANVFIQAKNQYYAFDLVPGFWNSLIRHAADGTIGSIDRVKQELVRGKDRLADWAASHFSHAFSSTDEAGVIDAYRQVMSWVQHQAQFSDAAKADFASGADGWLVAYAIAKGHVVVTHEQLAPEAERNVPIPNVCKALNVRSVDTFAMLRELKVQLVERGG